jgi:TonB family protein
VKSTRVIFSTGSEKLDQLAQEAVSKWQFKPGLTNGQPTAKRVIVPITFKIEKRSAGVLKRK